MCVGYMAKHLFSHFLSLSYEDRAGNKNSNGQVVEFGDDSLEQELDILKMLGA